MGYDIAGMMQGIGDTYKKSRSNTLAQMAFTNGGEKRQSALAELAGINPDAAYKLKSDFDEQDKADLAEFSRMFVAAPETMKPKMFDYGKQRFGAKIEAMGGSIPATWQEAMPLIEQIAGGSGQAKARSSHILADGTIAYMDEYGKLTRTNEKASNSYGFQTDAQGNVFAQDKRAGTLKPAGMGGDVPQTPNIPSVDDVENTAQIMLRDGAPVDVVNRWTAAQIAAIDAAKGMGNITSSQATVAVKTDAPKVETWGQPFEVMKDGKPILVERSNLGGERISQYSPKPTTGAVTEDMRKTATLVERMNNSVLQIDEATKSDPSAKVPGLGVAVADMLPEFASNATKGGQRQIVEAAQLDALDAALTLATGAAYTKEQLFGLRKSYFPQFGDKPETVKAKKARFDKLIQDAKIRAGSAAKQSPNSPVQIQNTDDYNRLPSGAQYIDPNGKLRVKK